MDYTTQREQIEAQIRQRHEEAEKAYEANKLDMQFDLKSQIKTTNSNFSDYEKLYQQTISHKPDMDQLMKEFETNRQTITRHNERLENKCRDLLTTLETTTWRKMNWQTLGGLKAYWDTENNYIWVVDLNKVSLGAYKPESEDQMEEIIKASGLTSQATLFNFVNQPNGYMFETNM